MKKLNVMQAAAICSLPTIFVYVQLMSILLSVFLIIGFGYELAGRNS